MQSAPAGSAELVIHQRWRLPDSSSRHCGSFRPRSFTKSVNVLTSPRKNSWNAGSCGHAPRFSNIPNDIEQELRYVEAAGTKTLLIAADPGKVHLLAAAEIEPALKAGRERALREADRVKAFWA
jgi:hypothetical protein